MCALRMLREALGEGSPSPGGNLVELGCEAVVKSWAGEGEGFAGCEERRCGFRAWTVCCCFCCCCWMGK